MTANYRNDETVTRTINLNMPQSDDFEQIDAEGNAVAPASAPAKENTGEKALPSSDEAPTATNSESPARSNGGKHEMLCATSRVSAIDFKFYPEVILGAEAVAEPKSVGQNYLLAREAEKRLNQMMITYPQPRSISL